MIKCFGDNNTFSWLNICLIDTEREAVLVPVFVKGEFQMKVFYDAGTLWKSKIVTQEVFPFCS